MISPSRMRPGEGPPRPQFWGGKEIRQRGDQVGEAFGDLVQRPREQGDAAALDRDAVQYAVALDVGRDVGLGTDTVELVLDDERRRHLPGDIGQVRGGRGEHELDRVEEPHPGLTEQAMPGQPGGLANVAFQHVDPLDLADGDSGQPGDGVLHRALF